MKFERFVGIYVRNQAYTSTRTESDGGNLTAWVKDADGNVTGLMQNP